MTLSIRKVTGKVGNMFQRHKMEQVCDSQQDFTLGPQAVCSSLPTPRTQGVFNDPSSKNWEINWDDLSKCPIGSHWVTESMEKWAWTHKTWCFHLS